MATNKLTTPIRVLHVVGNSRFGGAGKIILGLGNTAKAEGWQVDVLTTDPVFQQAVRQNGLGLVNLDVIRREIRPMWDIGGLLRLRDFLRREPYSIVHTHTSKGGFVGRFAAALAEVPVVVHTVHGFAFHERSSRLALLVYSAMEKLATRWCDRVVSVSEFHRRLALDLRICEPAQIMAIPNGVADSRRASGSSPELRKALGVVDNDLLILNMARLATDKGLPYLLHAASALKSANLRFRIVIAGEGPERERLESLARELNVTEVVVFLGFRRDVAELLAAADMVVLPSLREGLSIALLEAMAAGKPIIATEIGGHHEVIAQSHVARVVSPADSEALANAILELASDPASMTHLGAAARALFEDRYTEEKMLSAYRQLYLDLLEQKCPGYAEAIRGVPLTKLPEPAASVLHGPGGSPCQSKGGGIWNES